jgi:hypothetical protein
MPRPPDLALHALWRERIQRQARSGLSIPEFCVRERLSVSSFSNWKYRLQRISVSASRPALPAPSAFVPVTVRMVENTHSELLPIEVDLPNGIRLRIPTSDARLACRLVRTVAGARTGSGARK